MPRQLDLLPPTAGFSPDPTVVEPRLWVRELRIYRHLAPSGENLLRRIQLRRGLNILWARPRETSGRPTQRRTVSGHGTGKTTFCRFLRHILGEGAFGTDEQRARLRHVFPDAWLVGEVFINGTPWVVCRPFKLGLGSHAYRGLTLADLFTADESTRVSFDDYKTELNRAYAEPLPVATFATAPTPIEWPHVLQWLTRDQECRFSGLVELRHASSESQAPDMQGEDRHFLYRAVLGLIDTAEQSELEKNKELLRKKQEAERDAPLLRFRGDSVFKRMRTRFPYFRTDLDGADFLDALAKDHDAQAKASESALKTLVPPPELTTARRDAALATLAVQNVERSQRALRVKIGFIEQQIRQLQGKQTEDDTARWVRENNQEDGLMCGHTLAEAIEWECPLASGRRLAIEQPPTALDPSALIARHEANKARLTAQFATLAGDLIARQADAQRAQETTDRLAAAFDQQRSELARKRADEAAVADEARRAHTDKTTAETLDASLAQLEQNIRRSQELQAKIREASNAALSAFSETFGRVTRAVLEDDELKCAVRFHGRKLKPFITEAELDLTSAALETLKIICFDLAALISGVEGRGQHPLFLIHDGPREADLDASIYRNLFTAVRSLEEACGERAPAFQYIITTTEPPPTDLQQAPWLIDPVLNATTPQGKLLGESF